MKGRTGREKYNKEEDDKGWTLEEKTNKEDKPEFDYAPRFFLTVSIKCTGQRNTLNYTT